MQSKKLSGTVDYQHQAGRPWKVVMVRWRDAASYHGWRSADEEIPGPLTSTAVGFLRSRLAGDILITQNISEDGDMAEQFAVPSGMVEEIKEIGEMEDYQDAK